MIMNKMLRASLASNWVIAALLIRATGLGAAIKGETSKDSMFAVRSGRFFYRGYTAFIERGLLQAEHNVCTPYFLMMLCPAKSMGVEPSDHGSIVRSGSTILLNITGVPLTDKTKACFHRIADRSKVNYARVLK
jgi:hypothetical protein